MTYRLKKIILIVFLVVGVPLALESISAYIIYRRTADFEGRRFNPNGSATVALVKLAVKKVTGNSDVSLRIDHGPLFVEDATLGYSLHPGSYDITEQRQGQNHRFHLTVDDGGRRSTSYFPTHMPRRIFICGDSAMFGWGLNDEETVPWLLQQRLPQYQVVNLSSTSFSTVHALLQLRRADVQLSSSDIVVLTYKPSINDINVASQSAFFDFRNGLEARLGDTQIKNAIYYPFGSIDEQGKLMIRRVDLFCSSHIGTKNCVRDIPDPMAAMQVTKHAFDEIIALHPGRVLVAILSGADSDPVISHLRAKGVAFADLRALPGDPDISDAVDTDGHAGPFRNYLFYVRLLAGLQNNHLIN